MASQQNSPQVTRIPRGSTNIKNNSNDIFKWGGSLDYALGSVARYDRTPVADLEKKRAQEKRDLEAKRNLTRRNWIAEIEQTRWNKMAQDYCKKEQDWLTRHSHTKIGKNSVSYNPITLEYHKNSEGNKLSQDDAKALYRTSMRAAHLYLKNNTFDPLRCQDIPRRLVIDPNGTMTDNNSNAADTNTTELDVPRRLVAVAAQRAHIVKSKVADGAEKVLHAEMARNVNRTMTVAAAGTARPVSKKEVPPPKDAIVVELDGNGQHQHSWVRHF